MITSNKIFVNPRNPSIYFKKFKSNKKNTDNWITIIFTGFDRNQSVEKSTQGTQALFCILSKYYDILPPFKKYLLVLKNRSLKPSQHVYELGLRNK